MAIATKSPKQRDRPELANVQCSYGSQRGMSTHSIEVIKDGCEVWSNSSLLLPLCLEVAKNFTAASKLIIKQGTSILYTISRTAMVELNYAIFGLFVRAIKQYLFPILEKSVFSMIQSCSAVSLGAHNSKHSNGF